MDQRLQALRPDEADATPIYLQVARKLTAAIQAGQWRAGDALPSERTLVDSLGISRVTARHALQVLAEEGAITRNRGAGTFIAPRAEPRPARLDNFSELARRRGMTPASELVGFERRRATAQESAELALAEGDEIVRLTRLRKADGRIYWMDVTTLALAVVPDASAIGESLYAYLERIGKPVLRVTETLRAVVATAELAARLGIEPGEPLLHIRRTGYTHGDKPVELTDAYCLNDFYELKQ
ncbi:GntR family transcriptional regulator [Cupriavidus taiwanensis]|uniref:GntR family transcriptional regulator n=1 Tax=Cupriavidus taiwanensis TaxID=164546 RepID=UPI000E10A4B5|nr:GntR family transcriptional regulator [Cupriavidus taiwanensis]SPA28501.1 putative transcriptional regulator, GntR family, small molecule-binding UbiC domain [Cupriavidus taiwanensis]SPA47815.1 putative transcriptional regulator, GntR family, small molecule-binding UbiC domain [Cupriavidus taiwanensis]